MVLKASDIPMLHFDMRCAMRICTTCSEENSRICYLAPALSQSRQPEVTAGTPTTRGARIKPKVTAGRRKSEHVVQIRMAHRMSKCNIGMSETFKPMRVIVQNAVSACRKSAIRAGGTNNKQLCACFSRSNFDTAPKTT